MTNYTRMTDLPSIHRPIPRRIFNITPATPTSTDSSVPPSPSPENTNPELLLLDRRPDLNPLPSRTRSILNLTSSTLLGIYSPTGHEGSREESSTPWGTGAQTPSHRRSMDDSSTDINSIIWDNQTQRAQTQAPRSRTGFRGYYLPLLFRILLLFAFGVAYGTILTRLHKTQNIAPLRVQGIDRHPWYYHIAWGFSGVVLGNALPWVDTLWDSSTATSDSWKQQDTQRRPELVNVHRRSGTRFDSGPGADWYAAVRSVGAFVGIAFAVRKLPWQSTLQVSLTLALANPVLWYLIDRSKPGFAFSAAVGVAGTLLLLAINPDLVPLPATPQPKAFSESVGIFTWMASILFCTSVCFGAIGRKVQS